MREPTLGGPANVPAINAAVDRFFQRMRLPALCRMIAPVCAGCGREVDKTAAGWVHVDIERGEQA